MHSALWQGRDILVTVRWPLLGAVQRASRTGLQADTQVRKLEDERRTCRDPPVC